MGIVAAVGGFAVGFDVFGGNRRADEDEVVVEIRAVENLGGHRVEEGFRQFGLFVVEEQTDVEQLDLLPGGVVDAAGVELAAQALDAFVNAVVVKRIRSRTARWTPSQSPLSKRTWPGGRFRGTGRNAC